MAKRNNTGMTSAPELGSGMLHDKTAQPELAQEQSVRSNSLEPRMRSAPDSLVEVPINFDPNQLDEREERSSMSNTARPTRLPAGAAESRGTGRMLHSLDEIGDKLERAICSKSRDIPWHELPRMLKVT